MHLTRPGSRRPIHQRKGTMRWAPALTAIAVLAAACSLSTQVDSEPSTTTVAGVGDTAPSGTGGIFATQIDGVWVFTHNPRGGMDALHGGTATVRDGCLYIDDTIVIWPVADLAEPTRLISEIAQGGAPDALVAGGGFSLGEGAGPDDIPATVRDRCPAAAIWLGAP